MPLLPELLHHAYDGDWPDVPAANKINFLTKVFYYVTAFAGLTTMAVIFSG